MNATHLMIAILGSGISLAGLITGLIVWLRADMKDMESRLRADMKHMETGLREDMQSMEERLQENINNVQQEVMDIGEDITALRKETAALRERMAHLEGLLDGLREAIVARAAWNASNTARGSITQDA